MDRRAFEKLKTLKKNLAKVIKIEKMIMIGSRARGDYFKHSDIDVIIVSDDFKGMKFPDRMSFIYKFWDEEEFLMPFCYTTEEFEKWKDRKYLLKKGLCEGILIK